MELRGQLAAIAVSIGLVSACTDSTSPLFQALLQRPNIAAGASHACRLADNGLASCWGDNSHGELGDGSETSSANPIAVSGGLRFTAIAAGAARTCGIVESGAAYCWGVNYS